MRDLGILSALLTLLTVPFERLGTVAFHKLDFARPLLPQSRLAAALLHHTIEGHALNCTTVYPLIPKLEPAARKAGVGIGKVLQEVFAEVGASSHELA